MEKNIHETTSAELNPKNMFRRVYELPSGMKFMYCIYIINADRLAVEVHFYYPNVNEYIVDVIPSHWLNSEPYYNTAKNNPYFIKFVHQSDMVDHS